MTMNGLIQQLDNLAEETFGLWDQQWVGFSWNRYFINHTRRVRALALDLAAEEGADADVLALAATLHDVTKRYDGDIVRDQDGNRIIGEDGLWRNRFLRPSRENAVTSLYSGLQLRGSLHSRSGAVIAGHVLAQASLPDAIVDRVIHCIERHVRMKDSDDESAILEADILFDADTLDANLGLVAFYRNIMIHCHRAKRTHGQSDSGAYIRYIPDWLDMKDPFIERMKTRAGRARALLRQKRVVHCYRELAREFDGLRHPPGNGLLSGIQYLIDQVDCPDIERDRRYLRCRWLPSLPVQIRAKAGRVCDLLDAEVLGKA